MLTLQSQCRGFTLLLLLSLSVLPIFTSGKLNRVLLSSPVLLDSTPPSSGQGLSRNPNTYLNASTSSNASLIMANATYGVLCNLSLLAPCSDSCLVCRSSHIILCTMDASNPYLSGTPPAPQSPPPPPTLHGSPPLLDSSNVTNSTSSPAGLGVGSIVSVADLCLQSIITICNETSPFVVNSSEPVSTCIPGIFCNVTYYAICPSPPPKVSLGSPSPLPWDMLSPLPSTIPSPQPIPPVFLPSPEQLLQTYSPLQSPESPPPSPSPSPRVLPPSPPLKPRPPPPSPRPPPPAPIQHDTVSSPPQHIIGSFNGNYGSTVKVVQHNAGVWQVQNSGIIFNYFDNYLNLQFASLFTITSASGQSNGTPVLYGDLFYLSPASNPNSYVCLNGNQLSVFNFPITSLASCTFHLTWKHQCTTGLDYNYCVENGDPITMKAGGQKIYVNGAMCGADDSAVVTCPYGGGWEGYDLSLY